MFTLPNSQSCKKVAHFVNGIRWSQEKITNWFIKPSYSVGRCWYFLQKYCEYKYVEFQIVPAISRCADFHAQHVTIYFSVITCHVSSTLRFRSFLLPRMPRNLCGLPKNISASSGISVQTLLACGIWRHSAIDIIALPLSEKMSTIYWATYTLRYRSFSNDYISV